MQAHAFAPGRVNLIGEHTDYNDGLALPFAVELGVDVRARAIDGPVVEAVALDLGLEDRFELSRIEPASDWRAYPRGVVSELLAAGIGLCGMRLEIGANLPRGAGLGSSAALEVAVALASVALAEVRLERLPLARLCAAVEREWAGTQSGLLDQLATLGGEPGRALAIDFRSLELRPVALELGGFRLALLDSGERRTNAASRYNARRAECERACELLGLSSLRDARAEDAARLPPPLDARVRHVIEENARVRQAAAALERGELAQLGPLLDASHASLRDLYEVSTPALDAAVAALRRAGAIGARMIGGGFGGHALGLFPAGARLPDAAREVRPSAGATLVRQAPNGQGA